MIYGNKCEINHISSVQEGAESSIRAFRDDEIARLSSIHRRKYVAEGQGMTMAFTSANSLPFPAYKNPDPAISVQVRKRQITPQAGRAMKLLGRSIEYLANEFLHDSLPPSAQKGRLQAVRILMALNREIYTGCPEVPAPPSFSERCRWFLGPQRR